jgi:hypothetical protein
MKKFNVIFYGNKRNDEESLAMFFLFRSKTVTCESRGDAVGEAWKAISQEEEFKNSPITTDDVQGVLVEEANCDTSMLPVLFQFTELINQVDSYDAALTLLTMAINGPDSSKGEAIKEFIKDLLTAQMGVPEGPNA